MNLWKSTVVLPALALVSCGAVGQIDVHVDGREDAPAFHITAPQQFGSSVPCVSYIDVYRVGQNKPIWSVEQLSCRKIRDVIYGVVPVGFNLTNPAEPLTPNTIYRIDVRPESIELGFGSCQVKPAFNPLSALGVVMKATMKNVPCIKT